MSTEYQFSFEENKLLKELADEILYEQILENKEEFIAEGCLGAQKYLAKILQKQSIVLKQMKSQTTHSFENFEQLVDGINIFIQFMNALYRISPFNTDLTQDFKQLQFNLLCILKAIYSSYKKQDYFMLCDLLEHELEANLTQWKIKILARIKI